MTEAHPLHWPVGWPRKTKDERTRSRFGTWKHPISVLRATQEVYNELRRLGVDQEDVIVSTNLELRLDGLPRSNQRIPGDPGVAVYFRLDGNDQCIPCDKWDRVADNLWAIAKTIDALRGIDRWGAKEMVDAAFRGFKALPEPEGIITTAIPWYVVLELDQNANQEEIKKRYRELLKKHHPDVGGDPASFMQIQKAYGESQR